MKDTSNTGGPSATESGYKPPIRCWITKARNRIRRRKAMRGFRVVPWGKLEREAK